MTSFKEKLIIGALDDLIPDIEVTAPIKPESIKVKAIFNEMAGFMDMGNMKGIVEKITNVIIFSIEKSPDEEQKARRLLERIKIIIEST